MLSSPPHRPSAARKFRARSLSKRTVFILLTASAFFAAAVYLFNLPMFSISSVATVGAQTVSTSEIEQLVKEKLTGRYGLLFSKANFLFYPKRDIESAIKERFVKLKSVVVSLDGFHNLVAQVEERESYGVWCAGSESDASAVSKNTPCFLMDDGGLLYADSPEYGDTPYIRFGGNLASSTAFIGARYLPEEKFKELSFFLNAIGNLGLQTHSVFVNTGGDYDLSLKGGAKVMIRGESDLASALRNLEILIKDKQFLGGPEAISSKLEYIDLRFGEKIYYKFR